MVIARKKKKFLRKKFTPRQARRRRRGRSSRKIREIEAFNLAVAKKNREIAARKSAASAAVRKAAEVKAEKIRVIKLKQQNILTQKIQAAALIRRQDQIRRQRIKAAITGRAVEGPQVGTVTRGPQDFISIQRERRGILRTKKLRGIKLTPREELELSGRTVIQATAEFGVGIVRLPAALVSIARDPSQLRAVPARLKRGAEEFGELIRISPTEAFVRLGTEVFLTKGAGDALSIVGKVGKTGAARLSPSFRKVNKGIITIPPSKGGKPIQLRVVGAIDTFAQSIKKQARIAGTTVNAVSSQADRLIKILKTQRIVRKPVSNEKFLPSRITKLLSRFDKGTITKKELVILQGRVNLLERSFFADPAGRVRPSRLGLKQKRASLLDVVRGDFTIRASKPQILLFDNVVVQNFPKSIRDIGRRLKQGKPLTKSQGLRLFKFQQEKSGQFKPIGFISREPEITAAPGEILKKVGRAGTTIIDGVAIPIIRVKFASASAKVKALLKKADKGNLDAKTIRQIKRDLKKETGFTPFLSEKATVRPLASKPVVSPIRLSGASVLVKKSKASGVTKSPSAPSTPAGPTSPPPSAPSKPGSGARPSQPSRPSSVSKPTSASRAARTLRAATTVTTIRPITTFKKVKGKKKKQKVITGFNVFAKPIKSAQGKKSKRLVKINKVPLTKSKARDLRNFIIDTSLSRTGKTTRTRLKPKSPKLKFPTGYAARTSKKFRTFKIVKGKRIPLAKGKVIERRKHLLDTKQERQKITLRRRIKQISPKKNVVKKNVKKKMDPARRRQLLANLEKARRVRAQIASGARRSTASTARTTRRRRVISII